MKASDKDSCKTALLSMPKMVVTKEGSEREYHSYISEADASVSCSCSGKNTATMRLHSCYEREIKDVIPKWVYDNWVNPSILLYYNEYEFICKYCKRFAYPEVPFFDKYAASSHRFNMYIVNLAIKYPFSKISRDLEQIISDETVNNIFHRWIQQYECNNGLFYKATFEMALLGITIAGEACSVLFEIGQDGEDDHILDIFKNSDTATIDSSLSRITNRAYTGLFWIDHNSPFFDKIKNFFPNAKVSVSQQRYQQLISKCIVNELGLQNLKKPSYNLVFSEYHGLSKGRRKRLNDLENSNPLIATARNMFEDAIMIINIIPALTNLDGIKIKYSNDPLFSSILEKEIFPYVHTLRNVKIRNSLSNDTLNLYNYITNSVNHVVNKNCKFETIRARILYSEEFLNDYRKAVANHFMPPNGTKVAMKNSTIFNLTLFQKYIYHWEVDPQHLYRYTDKEDGLTYYQGIPLWVAAENLKRIERKGIRQHQFFWDMEDGTNHSYHSGTYIVSDCE